MTDYSFVPRGDGVRGGGEDGSGEDMVFILRAKGVS